MKRKKVIFETVLFGVLAVLLLIPAGDRSAQREKRMERLLPEPRVEWKL